MKIALLTDGIWPFVIGGMQKHSYYLCKYLARQKVYIDLYHTTKDNSSPKLDRVFSNEELKYIHARYIPYPSSDRWPGHYLRTSYAYSALISDALFSNSPVDVIYAKGLSSWDLLKQKADGKIMPPVCINVHGYEYYQRTASFKGWLEQLMFRPFFKRINKRADYIFSYSPEISKIITANISGTDHKILEVPTGVESDLLRTSPVSVNKPRQFVFIGRFERRKGIQELLSVFDRLDETDEFTLHFIGNIFARYRRSSPKYVFHGQLDNIQTIKSVLEQSDVLICPSYAEGMPNVILEGMACGCAVIASDVGAIPRMVTAKNGIIIKPADKATLADAIRKILNMRDDELKMMKQASLELVRRDFLWDNLAGRIVLLFNKLTQGHGSKHAG